MRDFDRAVYIGRFQPFHNSHLEVVKRGLEIADELIIVVGSINAAPNIKNPWTFEERREMILSSLEGGLRLREGKGESAVDWFAPDRVHVVGVRDYYYNENTWISEVQSQTTQFIRPGDTVALIGNYKDASSYYFKHFPQWEFQTVRTADVSLAGSRIRDELFSAHALRDYEGKPSQHSAQAISLKLQVIKTMMPAAVHRMVATWSMTSKLMPVLAAEWQFIREYKAKWAAAPFPPIFVTTDAVVVCSGHVLVVRRKVNPGKGLLALPGGFLKEKELFVDGMLRELREETLIDVAKPILRSSIVAEKVFDHPERSLRGRTITRGYYIKLRDGSLPTVKGRDDADRAFWMPLMDVAKNESSFFEDHSAIIHYFVNT